MSLYLKYRPLDFTNLVGQDFVKNTLQKSINDQNTVGAYLLCGPRGTGKTSTARILAKTINCLNSKKGNPCLKCNICLDFIDERLIDIIEIDAASHTGVDNIRELIEKAQFKPTKTKYKIYIIDEVHMLSKGAFNALLKILEEPPEHIKFILATTETHKVPETIISRCQRYDFKRISDIDIENRLKIIAENEKVKVDQKSYNYIIQNSGGGLRNAISLFEQFIIDNEINYKNILNNLGLVNDEKYQDFLNKLINKDNYLINDFEQLIEEGKNIKLFFKDLIFYTKNYSINELKKGNNINNLIYILDTLDETYSKTKQSLDENITFLIGLMKILSDFENQIIKTEKNNDIKRKEEKKIKTLEIKENIENEKEKISTNDVNEIFGENKSNFDKNIFINQLKKDGAKGGLTMAIRGINYNFDGKKMTFNTKTKIVKNQLNNSDNSNLIKNSLEKISFPNVDLIIN